MRTTCHDKMVLGTPVHGPSQCLECLDVLPASGEWKILDRHPTRSILGALLEAQNPSALDRSRPPFSSSLMSLKPSFANPQASYLGRVRWHPRDWLGFRPESRLERCNLGSPSISQSRSRQPPLTPLLSEFESCHDQPSKLIVRDCYGDGQWISPFLRQRQQLGEVILLRELRVPPSRVAYRRRAAAIVSDLPCQNGSRAPPCRNRHSCAVFSRAPLLPERIARPSCSQSRTTSRQSTPVHMAILLEYHMI